MTNAMPILEPQTSFRDPVRLPPRDEISRLSRFLWHVGGFDPGVLARQECRSVRAKYSTMGALILATAILSSFSASYALFTIFHNPYVAFGISVLWGLTVLCVDRMLVSSSRKNARPRDFNTESHKLPPFVSNIPWQSLCVRLPIAIMIGIVVSKPIESRIMQPWIRAYERSQAAAHRSDVERDPTLVRLQQEIHAYEDQRDAKMAEVETNRHEASCESDGTCGSFRRGAMGIWEKKDGYYQNSVAELNKIAGDLRSKQQEFAGERTKLLAQVESDSNTGQHDRSIVDDLESIDAIAAANTIKGRTVWKTANFLMLFFIFVECIPVLAKAISPFDPYDAEIQQSEHTAILDSLVGARRRYAHASLSD